MRVSTTELRATLSFAVEFDTESLARLIADASAAHESLTEHIQTRVIRALTSEPQQEESTIQRERREPPILAGAHLLDDETRAAMIEELLEPQRVPPRAKEPEPEPTKETKEPKPDPAVATTPTGVPWPEPTTKKKPDTPTGLLNILALAERIHQIRMKSLANSGGSTSNRTYVKSNDKAMKEAGFDGFSVALRQELAKIGRDGEAILAWAAPQGDALDHLTPSGLLYRWERHKRSLATNSKGRPRLDGKPPGTPREPAEVAKREAVEIRKPPSPLPSTNGEVRSPIADPYPDRMFKHFGEVNQLRLNSYDLRVLRRFTESLRRLGHGAKAESSELAEIIREIRGNERGDTPFCAQRLAALGVLVGISGSYHLRREYLISDYFLTNAA